MMTAELVMNSSTQAACLPKECRINGDGVYVQKVGNAIMLAELEYGLQLVDWYE